MTPGLVVTLDENTFSQFVDRIRNATNFIFVLLIEKDRYFK